MPKTTIVIYQESQGNVPLVDWLDSIPPKVRIKCVDRISRLHELGFELRRPEADYLRDGIYELRIGFEGTNYRILYSYVGKQITLLTHGIVKENIVPPAEIELALTRKNKWGQDPKHHTFQGDL